MSLKLMPNQVAVKLPEQQEKVNGIILPESAKEAPQVGEVIGLGEHRKVGSRTFPYEVAIGDQILFPKYAGTQVKIDDNNYYLLLTENDILCVVL